MGELLEFQLLNLIAPGLPPTLSERRQHVQHLIDLARASHPTPPNPLKTEVDTTYQQCYWRQRTSTAETVTDPIHFLVPQLPVHPEAYTPSRTARALKMLRKYYPHLSVCQKEKHTHPKRPS